MAEKIKVADYIINHLSDIGVTDVFVVYGAANGNLIDAFTRNDKIQYVLDNFNELNEKINTNFRDKFMKEYQPDELCLYWYDIFSNLSSIQQS